MLSDDDIQKLEKRVQELEKDRFQYRVCIETVINGLISLLGDKVAHGMALERVRLSQEKLNIDKLQKVKMEFKDNYKEKEDKTLDNLLLQYYNDSIKCFDANVEGYNYKSTRGYTELVDYFSKHILKTNVISDLMVRKIETEEVIVDGTDNEYEKGYNIACRSEIDFLRKSINKYEKRGDKKE